MRKIILSATVLSMMLMSVVAWAKPLISVNMKAGTGNHSQQSGGKNRCE